MVHAERVAVAQGEQSKTFTVFTGTAERTVSTRQTTRTLTPTQVLVRITHSGLCGTDCHYKHLHNGLGHEGVGVVESLGSSTKRLNLGDLVGWGYIHNVCGQCKACLRGDDAMCEQVQMYQDSDLDQGSLASYAVWEEAFLFKVPEGMEPHHAAPLMCGGATVFTPLYSEGVKPTDTVGIVGIGGLGHLAIQFAAKFGCRVVVFSGSESKRQEALGLGASEFHIIPRQGKADLSGVPKINYLIVTANVQPNWDALLPAMAKRGKIFPLSIAFGDLVLPYLGVVMNGLSVVGSIVASRYVHEQMLEFSARHGVKPMTEEFPMTVEGIKKAFEKLESGRIRYRAVLKN